MFFGFLRRKHKNKDIKDWLNTQSDLKDALLYLVEKEIVENGYNDLAYKIPRYRNRAYFDSDYYGRASHHSKNRSNVIFADKLANGHKRSQEEKQFSGHNHLPSELEALRGRKTHNKESIQEENITARHVSKVRAINHAGNVAKEEIFLQQPQERDLSALDLTCFDD